jgi:hypothetical protein
MKLLRLFALSAFILVLGFAPAAFAQSFAVTATPVNSGSSGTVSVQYAVTGIPDAGTLVVSCQYSGSSTYQEQNRLPICGVGPIAGFPVTAGQSITGGFSIAPWGTPIPAASTSTHATTASLAPASSYILAGALLLGFTFLRNSRRWFYMTLIAAGALSIAAGLSSCGGNSNGSMPGVYPYTVTATDLVNVTGSTGPIATTTVMVTVK